MEISVSKTKAELGAEAASKGLEYISLALKEKGSANIILTTGASQFEMLGELVKAKVDWSKVMVFHLDEYIGIPESHPASFRKYLKDRFTKLVKPAEFHAIDGLADPEKECSRLNRIIKKHPLDVAFVGIGENGEILIAMTLRVVFQPDEASIAEDTARGYKTGNFITIEGDPGLEVEVQGLSDAAGVTAIHTVNAIPYVVNARPGFLSPRDFPPFVPRMQ